MANCNPTSESPREEKYSWIVLYFAKLPFKMPVLIYSAISNVLRPAHLCSLVSISYYHLNVLANLIGEHDILILRSCIYLITSKLESFAMCIYQLYFLSGEFSLHILFIRAWIFFFSICMSFIIKISLGLSFWCNYSPFDLLF